MALVREVFALAAGEQAVAAVAAFLRRQRLTSLRCACAATAGAGTGGGHPPAALQSCRRTPLAHALPPLLAPAPRSDFEFLELAWLERELGQGPHALPPLLLNKFVQLGRKRVAPAPALTPGGGLAPPA